MSEARQPALFVGHGSPMNAIEENGFTRSWRALGSRLSRPRAILAISAHWQTRGTSIGVAQSLETIHDFGGFPDALFAAQYPARGDPDLARAVARSIAPAVGGTVAEDPSWGLDHGVWSVLMHLYPEADVPVVALSMDVALSPQQRLAVGEALAPWREEGVLILGTGNIVHNLRTINWQGAGTGYDWCAEFDAYMRDAVARHDTEALIHYDRQPAAARAVPTPEHLDPLFYCYGAGSTDPVSFPCEGLTMGSISMRAVLFGGPAA